MTEDVADTGAVTTEAGEAQAESQAVPVVEATEAKAEAVPESYEFQMPEGVELDKAAADEFTAIAKEKGFDQATAQQFADIAARMAQRQQDTQAAIVESWVEQVKTDKELGGDKLDANLAVAKKAMDTFGTPELRDVLNSTGLGNNPEVIRAFFKAGKAISEDAFVKGSPPGGQRDAAKTMFPSMN